MANITASEVNKLRQITGAGMMDCKNALVEANGNIELAIDNLRKKGRKVASKRADKSASEGYAITKVSADGKKGIIVSLNCETDFVAKSEEFIATSLGIADVAISNNINTIEALMQLKLADGVVIAEKINQLVGKIGEKIEIATFDVIEAALVYGYNHPGNKVASLVGMNKKDVTSINNIIKDIAMQVAAMIPVALDKEDVDPKLLERELEIAKDLARQEGKPENMIEKISQGRIQKFYSESTLLNQDFIKENKKTVRQFLADADKDLKITAFKRVALG